MMKEILIFSLCIAVAYGAQALANAPVTAEEKSQGYACKSSDKVLGLMKEGEARTNYEPNLCGEASCNDGLITYTTCGSMHVEGCNAQPDPSKPYPRCCTEFICV